MHFARVRNLQAKSFLSISGNFKTLQRSSTELKYTELRDTHVAIMDTHEAKLTRLKPDGCINL